MQCCGAERLSLLDERYCPKRCESELKTLKGLSPYEFICKISTNEPKRFILNPLHELPGLNT